MSISQAIQNAQQKVANAYTAVQNKGGTMPATQNLSNLPTAIGTITQTNLTTLSVTTNGTYTPSSPYNGYSQVDVSVNAVNNTAISITPTTSAQSFTVSAPYTGYNPISVSAVTSSIDANIQPKFIRNGVEILGVTGTYGEPVPPLKVNCCYSSTWYITPDGELYGCGSSANGQQGDGRNGSSDIVTTFTKRADNVVQVAINKNLTQSGTTYGIWYINSSGELYGTGYNSDGQQGSGDTTVVTTFTKRADNVVQVACCSNSTWYINSSGELYGCGSGSSGHQGNGSLSGVTTFTKRADNVKQVFSGLNQTLYIDNNNTLYGCGSNIGLFGSQSYSFTQIATNVKDVYTSNSVTFYIDSNGDLYGCGAGSDGQQGNGGTSAVTTFTKRAENVKQVICGQVTWYVTNDGELYGTGYNYDGQQGSGTSGSSAKVLTFTQRATNVKMVASGMETTWYVTNDGDLYGCGNGSSGQQSNGSATYPNRVTTFTKRASNVKEVICSPLTTFYIDNNDNLYGCGNNSYGQQGNGGTSAVTTFTKINY